MKVKTEPFKTPGKLRYFTSHPRQYFSNRTQFSQECLEQSRSVPNFCQHPNIMASETCPTLSLSHGHTLDFPQRSIGEGEDKQSCG